MAFSKKLKELAEWIGHGKTVVDIIIALGGGKGVQAALIQFTKIPPIWITPIWLFSSAVILWVLLRFFGSKQEQIQSAVQSGGFNLGAQSPVNFDAPLFFRTAYHSNWTRDVENRIRLAAHQNEPNDHESFYARFIGIGYVAYHHDMTWAYIYKSQVLMLTELNRRGGMMASADARPFYDRATAEYPSVYGNYSFDQWLAFIIGRVLILRHPSDMLEITVGGRDFLSYLAHYSRSADDRKG